MPPIPFIGGGVGGFLAKAAGGSPVDVIAYSSGGLFVRAYLSGILPPNCCGYLVTGNPSPPIHPLIRKLVLIASPNFGIAVQLYPQLGRDFSAIGPMLGQEGNEALPLSESIWKLDTWNARSDDLRGIDTVAIAGNGDSAQATDGLVSVNSASVGVTLH
jgi:hypothetical protein